MKTFCLLCCVLVACFLRLCLLLLAALGVLLGRSWPLFGRSSHAFGSLGRSWAALGRSWASLGHSWELLGRSWDTLGALSGRSWALLGHSWVLLGHSWPGFGRTKIAPQASLAPGRRGPRESRNAPAGGSDGCGLRGPKTHGTAATVNLEGGGGKRVGSRSRPLTLRAASQDLKILVSRVQTLNTSTKHLPKTLTRRFPYASSRVGGLTSIKV